MSVSLKELLDRVRAAVSLTSDDAGVRIRSAYEVSGGPGAKVFPPTYAFDQRDSSHKYVIETRYDSEGEERTSVLLDAIQSQANRCELALLDAADDGVLWVPYLETSGEIEVPDSADRVAVRITSLEAPHRGPDAYFRDSEDADGTAFDDTVVGKALGAADQRHARAFFEHVPTDLIFGFWDSQRGGRGIKLPRAYTSEVFGWDPIVGDRGAGRMDPMNITKTRIAYPDKKPGEFVVLGDGPTPKGMKEKKPSEAGHGNIPPSHVNPGVSVTSIERSAFLSATALARLRFASAEQESTPEHDLAGRSALFCLGLAADRLAFNRAAVYLRSGCELLTVSSDLRWVGRGGDGDAFELSTADAVELAGLAVRAAADAGLEMASDPLRLNPKSNLRGLLAETLSAPPSED